jgi:hypothetical protein
MKLKIPRVVKQWKYASMVEPSFDFQLNTSGPGRRFATQDTAPYWREAFYEFNLNPVSVEPIFKNLTGNHFEDGAFVHAHTDCAPNGFVHARCNLMLRKPKEGGNPILDGEEFDVKEGDLWLCLASMEVHSSTPIKGGERLIFSFGGLVPIDQTNKILFTESKKLDWYNYYASKKLVSEKYIY